jgi:hypothetical protein
VIKKAHTRINMCPVLDGYGVKVGARGSVVVKAVVVKALCCKPEGRGFKSR